MIAVSRTNRGLVRHNNEDSVLVREPDLFAIADGMGGADAGEVASYEAVHLLESLDLSQVDRTNILSSLETVIIRINKKIFDLASEKKALSGMGTTLTALYLPNRETAYVAHVGDSRIYLYGENSCAIRKLRLRRHGPLPRSTSLPVLWGWSQLWLSIPLKSSWAVPRSCSCVPMDSPI